MTKKISTIADLTPDAANLNKGTERGHYLLETSLSKLGAGRSVLVDANGVLIAGNKTAEVAGSLGIDDVIVVQTDGKKLVVVQRTDLDMANPDDARARQLAFADNQVGRQNLEWDAELLMQAAQADDLSDYIKPDELKEIIAGAEDGEESSGGTGVDAEPQIDKASELQKKWKTERGQVWQLGDHRLMCGDSTSADDVTRLMGGEKAQLVHADPPYGMGKEKDGVANDNLYSDKLDAFQMAWWRAVRPHMQDNASAYIWGNAKDLWRLWYRGGLKDSERLTLRNEIVWDKGGSGFGVGTEAQRCFFPTERCLFFMLGEQGFNDNADNYWEGWEPIRGYLDGERIKMGWSKPQVETILGSINKTQHTFSQSHFNLIQEVDYLKLQTVANGRAFQRDYDDLKREYDDLKREFYSTRAYFNNTHDNMTDVWSFGRVTGDERRGHATPKPVDMICRAVKSSSQSADIIVEPFGGSGTTLIACEQTGRKCRTMEIAPEYVAVALQRWGDATGKTPELIT